MTNEQTERYIDHLDDLVSIYNNRGHRTLKYMSPNEAELDENEGHVRAAFNEKYSKLANLKKQPPKYAINDIVRIKLKQRTFARGYHEQFKRELFKIVKVNQNLPITTYEVQSLNDDVVVQRSFYHNELSQFKGDTYLIEKVLDRRRVGRKPEEIFVKWLDFDDSHNQWIPAKAVTKAF